MNKISYLLLLVLIMSCNGSSDVETTLRLVLKGNLIDKDGGPLRNFPDVDICLQLRPLESEQEDCETIKTDQLGNFSQVLADRFSGKEEEAVSIENHRIFIRLNDQEFDVDIDRVVSPLTRFPNVDEKIQQYEKEIEGSFTLSPEALAKITPYTLEIIEIRGTVTERNGPETFGNKTGIFCVNYDPTGEFSRDSNQKEEYFRKCQAIMTDSFSEFVTSAKITSYSPIDLTTTNFQTSLSMASREGGDSTPMLSEERETVSPRIEETEIITNIKLR